MNRLAIPLLCMLSQSPGLASAAVDPRPPEEMEEVQVLAARIKLSELRAEIFRTEDSFYKHFNELMDDPEMRVACRVGPPVGSHISRRVCEPQFVSTANANYTRDLVEGLGTASLGGTYVPPVDPGIAIVGSEYEFRRKMIRLTKEDATLRELAQRREMLGVLLKAAQKARFKDKIFARD